MRLRNVWTLLISGGYSGAGEGKVPPEVTVCVEPAPLLFMLVLFILKFGNTCEIASFI